jgi:hypothetical protein
VEVVADLGMVVLPTALLGVLVDLVVVEPVIPMDQNLVGQGFLDKVIVAGTVTALIFQVLAVVVLAHREQTVTPPLAPTPGPMAVLVLRQTLQELGPHMQEVAGEEIKVTVEELVVLEAVEMVETAQVLALLILEAVVVVQTMGQAI